MRVADFMLTAAVVRTPQNRRSVWPFLSANDGLFLSLGLSSFYSELMKGLGAGGRLWELLERQPQMPFNGGSEVGLFRAGNVGLRTWHLHLQPVVSTKGRPAASRPGVNRNPQVVF